MRYREHLTIRNEVIPLTDVTLEGEIVLPESKKGLVIFAHGSGSGRFSPRNQYVANVLHNGGIGTLLFDLLTKKEDQNYLNRFDIILLASRLVEVTQWVLGEKELTNQFLGYFGASTGAAAALIAAARLGRRINSLVSRGGRPDLADAYLPQVISPTLLIVGDNDTPVLALNQQAYRCLQCEKKLVTIAGATHLFEESGALEQVAHQAMGWFLHYFEKSAQSPKKEENYVSF